MCSFHNETIIISCRKKRHASRKNISVRECIQFIRRPWWNEVDDDANDEDEKNNDDDDDDDDERKNISELLRTV